MQEVGGSIPPSSTKLKEPPTGGFFMPAIPSAPEHDSARMLDIPDATYWRLTVSKISLSQRHSKSDADVREMLDALAVKLSDRFEMKAHWRSDRELELKRSGIQGVLQLLEGEVKVDIQLGMMMKPFKSRIRDELSKAMAEKLA